MKFKGIALLASAGAALAATPALAQDDNDGAFFVGGQVGYHQVDIEDLPVLAPYGPVDESGFIFGGLFGAEWRVGDSPVTAGFELDANAGKGPVESDYGAVGYLGFNLGANSQISLRGGYREVKYDFYEASDERLGNDAVRDRAFANGPNQGNGWTAGVGARFGMGAFAVRGAVDTIEFDTIRGTVGLLLMFR